MTRRGGIWFLAAVMLGGVACNDEGMNYVEGPEDPALQVTEQEIAQVRQVLAEQAEEDRARGIRPDISQMTAPPLPNTDGELPEGHPPIEDDFEAPMLAQAGPDASGAGGAAAAGGGATVAAGPGETVRLQMLEATLPEGWRATPPSSSMRVAEIAVPDPAGRLKDAELVAFYFGPDQGGSVEANVERWLGQMTQPDGRTTREVAKTEQFDVNGIPVTLVEAPGTFAASPMMGGGQAQPLERWYLMAAIAETPQGPLFLKATGPDETLQANRERMVEFLKSLRPAGQGGTQRVETHGQVSGAPADSGRLTGDAGAGAGAAAGTPSGVAGGVADMGIITGELPANWVQEEPASSMRLAQFWIPPVEGDPEPGEVAVFYFGPQDGGGIEENIQRWYDQLQQPDGRPTAQVAQREELQTAGGLKVTLVDAPGSYTGMMMPGRTPQAKPDYRLLGAIVETPRGAVFIKGTGPDRTMSENRDEMIALLQSVRLK